MTGSKSTEKDIAELHQLLRRARRHFDAKSREDYNRSLPFPELMFDRWDTNSDGKVGVPEIIADYKLQEATTLSRVSATVAEQKPSLFSALDASADGRISLREMRTAGARLSLLDRNRDGRFGPTELTGQIEITFKLGPPLRRRIARQQPGPMRGPKWFIRMDKNGDGDVTLKEFLGDKKEFKKLDTNGDGFIEPKEAEAASKRKTSKD